MVWLAVADAMVKSGAVVAVSVTASDVLAG
jgi:hypothetical protein